MKTVFLLMLCGMIILTAVGCGTIKGIGDDVSAVGKWLSKGSDTVKQDIGK
jgi:predicted small secreted protein